LRTSYQLSGRSASGFFRLDQGPEDPIGRSAANADVNHS
jgi:hypothetical protein